MSSLHCLRYLLTFVQVPHRLLVMLLRRGALQGINTIEELLDGQQQNILIKDEFQGKPLFYGSTPKGLGLHESRPLTANSISAYIKARAKSLGYTENVTLYSLRRMIATELVARIGLDRTRILMGHAPNSRTLELYYFEMSEILDLTSAALQQDLAPGGISEKAIQEWAPLALSRLNDQQRNETRGRALRALTNKLINNDPNPPEDLEKQEVRNKYRARMRACAQRSLIEQQAAVAKQTLTQEEFAARKGAINASLFAEAVMKRAQELASSEVAVPDTAQEPDEDEASDLLDTDRVAAEGDLDSLAQQQIDEQQEGEQPSLGDIEMGVDQDVSIGGQDQVSAAEVQ